MALNRGMPVINQNGLVGMISVSENSAQVALITDRGNGGWSNYTAKSRTLMVLLKA